MAKTKPVLPLLEAGPVPLAHIRANAKKQLVDIVDSKRGKKVLILDPAIAGSLTQLDASITGLLAEHGITKLLYLERKRLDDSANTVDFRLSEVKPIIYIARATLHNAQLIAWQVQHATKGSGSGSGSGSGRPAVTSAAQQQHEFSVFWVPRRSIAVERVLEDEGALGAITQGEFALDMIALDDDVLSLELDGSFRECVLDGDASSLFYAASALMKLQHMFGLIPRLQGKGPAAKAVLEMVIKMRKESPLPAAAAAACRIHRAILLDRDVDPITPMVTQITFEGLIDEVTGISNGAVAYTPSKRDGAAPARGGSTLLNSTDPFYREFRDLPFDITSQRLQQYARDARKEYAELGSKDLSELKSFVKGLPKLLLLDRLSDLAVPVAEVVKQQDFHSRLKHEQDIIESYDTEESVAFIQGLMWRGADAMVVLRLLVLLSWTCGGLPKKHADSLRNDFLAAYGHQHLLTFNNLDKAGLLRPQGPGSTRTFSTLRKTLRLLTSDQSPQLPTAVTDVSQLYKGYTPISIRLVEAALKGGWGPIDEALSLLPGAKFDQLQVLEPSGQVVDKTFKPAATAAAGGAAGAEVETVLLVVLGGITFTEISALRFLSSLPENNVNFLVLTTKIVTGKTLLQSFVDEPAKNVRSA